VSCKTLASYKRNKYKYVSGHYQKSENAVVDQKENSIVEQNKSKSEIAGLGSKKDSINLNSVANSAMGNLAANTVSYGLKKVFAPDTLPATKGDIKALQKDINELKFLIKIKNQFPR
jgi:hypothetical protein